MHVLFVHQNYPAQFGHVAARLATIPGYRCTFVSKKSPAQGPVERIQYVLRGGATKHNHTCTRCFENAVHHALAVYAARHLVRDFYSVEVCLPRMRKLYHDVTSRSNVCRLTPRVRAAELALSGVAVG